MLAAWTRPPQPAGAADAGPVLLCCAAWKKPTGSGRCWRSTGPTCGSGSSRAGDPPGLDEGLTAPGRGGPGRDPARNTDQASEEYGIHPGVAAAGRDLAGTGFQKAADTELAAFWAAIAEHAREREAEQQTSGMVVRAGLAAAPYLLRLGFWEKAAQHARRRAHP